MKLGHYHLAYCTNIHPAESWEQTFSAIQNYSIKVKKKLESQGMLSQGAAFAIGLRLSAVAATELLQGDQLTQFKSWLERENCYVFTINGFPFGAFHNTRVKENVYRPDWTSKKRLEYTKQLFDILVQICPVESGGSVSTLPGSFKEFNADEDRMFEYLFDCAQYIRQHAECSGKDLHLGLEPEPLGHFENTEETIAFFDRFRNWAKLKNLDSSLIDQYIGINFDTCHIALEFDDVIQSLNAFINANLKISKIHLSNALEIQPAEPGALEAIKQFNEPTYLHQFMLQKAHGKLIKFRDLPEFFSSKTGITEGDTARIHFHIPLYQAPPKPLNSTSSDTKSVLNYLAVYPEICKHIEMETYTWSVFPAVMQKDMVSQLVAEYQWTLNHA